MELDVDGDFKKARAFLVAFSAAVLLAWYFSADLKAINIIGFSLKIQENAHNLWLVIAFINLHFLLRYIQKLPKECMIPDDGMRVAFEQVLISHCIRAYRHYMVNNILLYELGPRTEISVKIRPTGEMKYRAEWRIVEGDRNYSLERFRRLYDLKIVYSVPYEYSTGGVSVDNTTGRRIEIDPNHYAVVLSYIIGFFRGAVFTPWMSEYIIPVILGAMSVVVAGCSWWTVNY